jgi:outer membrane protein assembly factor BamB
MKQWTLPGMVALSMAIAPVVAAQDWPQWRGPTRDGEAPLREPASWPAKLTQRWKVEVGAGYSTPILVGDRVFVFSRQGEEEVMTALDAASGKVIWRSAYPTSFKMNPATAPHGPGPKSTPAYANNRLFTLGITGIVTAFDAQSGKQIWQKPAPAVEPLYHTGQSPVVDGDVVILHVGGHNNGALTAFDAATGSVRWTWTGDGPAYGSPLVLDISGTRQVVTFTQENLVGVSRANGQLLWQRPYKTPSTTTSQTPILYKDMIIESGRGNGITAFRAAPRGEKWTTDNVWHTDEVSVHMSDAVAVGNVLYGLSHLNRGQYFALDLDSGKVLWTSEPRQAEHAAMSRTANVVLSLEEDGELVVLRHNRERFEPITRYEVATSATWPQPAISGNRVFVKDVTSLTLWTLD